MRRFALLLLTPLFISCMLICGEKAKAADGSTPLSQKSARPQHEALWKFLHEYADKLPLNNAKPATTREWDARRQVVRAQTMQALGIDRLTKTPLNARAAGVIEKPEYTIEKIIFESRPGFYVTGNLWKPRGATGKLPVLLWVHGHSANAKAAYGWPQQSLARKGIMVFAIDGVGFGERIPQEHSMTGVCWTVGTGTLGFEIWDNIRAIDYLVSRGDVDAKRIAVAGRSGGGTQSLYMLAVEERLSAAVVMAGMSRFQAAYVERGDGHCICNYTNGIISRATSAEMLAVGAPDTRTLVIQGQFDPLFPSGPAENTFKIARDIYSLYGKRDNITFFSDFGQHPATDRQISETVKFLVKALNPDFKDYSVPELPEPSPDELLAGLPKDSATTIGICMEEAMSRTAPAAGTKEQWLASEKELREKLRGFVFPAEPCCGPLNAKVESSEDKGKYTVETVSIETEPGLRIGLKLYIQKEGPLKRKASVYVYRRGVYRMAEALKDNPDMLGAPGFAEIIAVPDLRGLGEQSFGKNGATESKRNYREYELSSTGAIIGRPLAGMRALDLIRVYEYVASRPDVAADAVSLVSEFDMAHISLLATSVDTRIAANNSSASITIRDFPGTFFKPELNEKRSMDFYIPGILRVADMPELAALSAPRNLLIAPRAIEDSAKLGIARRAYAALGAENNFAVEK